MNKLFPILILFISLTSFAQTEYIEVEVQDTITLKPMSYEYIFSVRDTEPNNFDENGDYDGEGVKKRLKANLKKLESLLKSKKYTFIDLEASSYNVNNTLGFSHGLLSVNVNTIEELNKLKELAESENYITGTLGNLEYADENKAEERLIKKLIEKAKAKAAMIASYSELKVRKIIAVKEVKQIDGATFNIMDFYINQQQKKKSFTGGEDLSGVLSKAMVVKFSVQ